MEEKVTLPQYPPPPTHYYGVGDKHLPPPIPSDETYLLFGQLRKLEESTQKLEEEDETQRTLYNTEGNPKEELRKLVLLSKTSLIEILTSLSKDLEQDEVDEKMKMLRLVFVNMIYLLNEMRQVQAKADVFRLLQRQIQAKKDRIVSLNNLIEKVNGDIKQHFNLNDNDIVEMKMETVEDELGETELLQEGMVNSSIQNSELDLVKRTCSIVDEEIEKLN